MTGRPRACVRKAGSVWTSCPCFRCRLDMAAIHAAEHDGVELPRAPYQQAWARLAKLIDAGWSSAALRDATGVPDRTMRDLVTAHHEGRHHRLEHTTCRKILGPLSRPADGSVPAVGTTRRLQALCFLGWNDVMIADLAGVDRKVVTRNRLGYNRRIRAINANAIEDAYRVLVLRGLGSCGTARARAERLGYVSPFAWNDDIDDPAARPRGIASGVAA